MTAAGKKAAGVIEVLNRVLAAELTAINQYFVHSEMCEHWGYDRLHEIMRGHAMDEMRHAEAFIERILFLEGRPDVHRLEGLRIGASVAEMMTVDLALEKAAVARLNPAIETCRGAGDNGSRLLLERTLASEEEHIDWLDAQIALIAQVGEKNYLAQQIR
jgi:bacterioferritin